MLQEQLITVSQRISAQDPERQVRMIATIARMLPSFQKEDTTTNISTNITQKPKAA
jgi:hypothetical protein